MATATDERLITDKDLSARWGWHADTPNVLRSRGRMPIPYMKIGKRVRYRLSDVVAYEERQTVAPLPH